DKVIPSLMNFSRKPGSIYDFDDALEELGCNSSNPWIPNQNGYASTVDSERNIFYVALTRAKKYLFLTYSNNYSNIKTKPSMFLNELIDSNNEYLSEYNPNISYTTDHLPIFEKVVVPVTLNFSVLSNYFDCPYRFKLANFYGFAQPFGEIQGYGKTMHEIMMHIHRAWIEKKTIDDEWIEKTVTESMNLPYANSVQIKNAIADATKCAKAYVQQNKKDADNIESAELDINIELGEGVSVNGRIDLVIKGQGKNAETMIVDLKCSGKDAEQCLNAEQLKIYAIGYKEMTGNDADYLMIYNLDKPDGSDNKQEPIKHDTLDETRKRIITAAKNIRKSNLPRVVSEKCENCYYKNLCNKKK
ncbi:MAG: PD-(D/E)XK nuclease family protein, partial [Lachnospiraceae bacterium]|nr:PD-(D/E)XK nuclease family protein [Lachnospiraceae bacterium]